MSKRIVDENRGEQYGEGEDFQVNIDISFCVGEKIRTELRPSVSMMMRTVS